MVDKDLFLHDLAVVAIMKCEGHYIKEWLDYHLLAGVDHFYLYDNESPDNQAEVVKPYVEAGLVDYFPCPGKAMQMFAYHEAVKNFKFQCRYMAFIDGDEFIFPKSKSGGGIAEVVDEILSPNPNAAALAINWQWFGSNGQEKADYSRGVLERFTRRAPSDSSTNVVVKSIVNPRAADYALIPHFFFYFEGLYAVNENGGLVRIEFNKPVTAEKIVVNHYYWKSREEYGRRYNRGRADMYDAEAYKESNFTHQSCNEEFDDGILRYRAERAKNFRPPDKSHADERLFSALAKNLSPTLLPNTPPQFYAGKMETFLTCRAVASYLKTKLADDAPAKFFEEASLKAILKTVTSGMTFADARILIRELPNLLSLPYPVVKDLRQAVEQIIQGVLNTMRANLMYKNYYEFVYLQDLLKNFKE